MTIPKPTLQALYFILALIALVGGVTIYPLFRGPNLLVWNILPKPTFWGSWQVPYPKEGIASVLVGSGPDCLWFLSGICVLRCLWYRNLKMQKLYRTVFYLVAAGYNLGQYFRLIPGTFDLLDVLTISGVALAEATVWKFFVGREI